MQFMMLMIPNVYRGNKKLDPGFVPDPKPTVTDGPFIETKEVLGGYWMVEANSKEELVKWAQRCPAADGDVIEIRQIFDEADFAIKK